VLIGLLCFAGFGFWSGFGSYGSLVSEAPPQLKLPAAAIPLPMRRSASLKRSMGMLPGKVSVLKYTQTTTTSRITTTITAFSINNLVGCRRHTTPYATLCFSEKVDGDAARKGERIKTLEHRRLLLSTTSTSTTVYEGRSVLPPPYHCQCDAPPL